MGRSYTEPSFFISAGAIFTVILDMGKVNPLFLIDALTLSRLSLTAASGSPTISNFGSPELKSASTVTLKLSRPKSPWLFAFSKIKSPAFLYTILIILKIYIIDNII